MPILRTIVAAIVGATLIFSPAMRLHADPDQTAPTTSTTTADDADDGTPDITSDNGIPWPPKAQQQGRLYKLQITTSLVRPHSPKRPERTILVYVPVGYNAPEHAADRYPAFYLLHGSPGKPHDFIAAGWPAISEAASKDLGGQAAILVMPDGNYAGTKYGDSEWANSADGRDRFEDFVVNEVVPWTDSHFRTVASQSGRVIAGVSEGGFGAVNLALRHPDVFGEVIAISGYYDKIGYGWARQVFGNAADRLDANTPLTYIDTGEVNGHKAQEWRSVRFFLGAGADEKRYTDDTRRLAEKLTSLQVPLTIELLDGKHNWVLWNQLFDYGMRHMPPASTSM